MKKIIIIMFLFLCPCVNAISAKSYIVYDTKSDRMLMGSNIHSPKLIASTTKIMTCIIALEKGDLNDIITIDKEVLKTTGSSIYLSLDEKISLKDLLYGMMLRSGNDAAIAVALYVSGSMDDFVKLMNEYAKNIGMNDSVFYNSTGLENNLGYGNISSAYDMAILTKYAMSNNDFKKIFNTKEYNCKTNYKTYHWQNKNKLLKLDYIIGGKTGYTLKAKRTLVTTGLINNTTIIIVTLNDPDDWMDHEDLYNILKENYSYEKLIDKNNIKLYDKSISLDNSFYTNKDFSYGFFKDDKHDIKYFLYDTKEYKDGDVVGKIEVILNNEVIYTDKIYIRVKKENIFMKIINKILHFK